MADQEGLTDCGRDRDFRELLEEMIESGMSYREALRELGIDEKG